VLASGRLLLGVFDTAADAKAAAERHEISRHALPAFALARPS
jgi:hypothetical protein